MKVKLSAALYVVEQAENGTSAIEAARNWKPDLILLDVMMPDMSGVEVCQKLREDPETADIPIVLITALTDREAKMEGLAAGADDFLTKPVDELTLLARVRSLLRARDNVRELRINGQKAGSFGFAEAANGFQTKSRPSHIALVAPNSKEAMLWKSAIKNRISAQVQLFNREAALSTEDNGANSSPDMFVISVDLEQRNEGLRLLSDLRSRPGTRHAATMMILPDGDSERSAIALDLGASDVLFDPFDAQEFALRIATHLDRKRETDRMRAGVRAGLEAAITDPLTGLYNRRYARHRMEQLVNDPGNGLAVMMVDLDHFKRVNDNYGHATGDAVLKQVADRLSAQIRPCDLLARIGGEEFLIALTDVDTTRALDFADRIRRSISDAPFRTVRDTLPFSVTASVGLVIPDQAQLQLQDAERLMADADEALYGAKSMGRDQVIQATSPAA